MRTLIQDEFTELVARAVTNRPPSLSPGAADNLSVLPICCMILEGEDKQLLIN